MPWTAEQDAVLKQSWTAGLTATQIMAEIPGFSRSAICGRVHRLKLPSRRRAGVNAGSATGVVRRKPRRDTPPPMQFTCREAQDLPPDTSEHAVSFFDAQPGQCRWPIGDTSNLDTFRFCGCGCVPDKSYCRRHFEWGTRPYAPRT